MIIIADVLSKRSEEQSIGRVGRLNKKGKWQRLLYEQGIKDSVQQYLLTKQETMSNEQDKRNAWLLSHLIEK